MEGSQPDTFQMHLEQVTHAVFHLASRLVGEGNGDDIVSGDALPFHQISQAAGKHARLSGSWSSQHQNLPVAGGNRELLLSVQVIKQRVCHGSLFSFRWVQPEIIDAINHRILSAAGRTLNPWRCIRQKCPAGGTGKELLTGCPGSC